MRLKVCLLMAVAAAIVLSSLFLLHNVSSFAADSQDELSVVLEGCRQAAQAAQSGKGQVTVYHHAALEDGGVLEANATDTVAFSGLRFKLINEVKMLKNLPATPPSSRSVLVAPGSVRTEQFAYDGEKATAYSPAEGRATIGDANSAGGTLAADTFVMVKPSLYTLFDLTNYGSVPPGLTREAPRIVGREAVNGDECIIVEVYDHGVIEGSRSVESWQRFWVNTAKGCAVSRIRAWVRGDSYTEKTLRTEVDSDLRQYADGVWGPAKVTASMYGINQTTREYYKETAMVITYAEGFQLNVAVTDSELTLTLPSGTTVTNELLQETYTMP